MKMASLGMILLVGTCAAVLSACGGDEADLTARAISDEELALMVLPQEDLGDEYAELEPDEEISGFVTNEESIAESQDPDDEGQDIERFGRVNAYYQAYSDDSGVWLGEQALYVTTGIELLRDSVSASARLEDEMADLETEFSAQAEEQEAEEVQIVPFSPGDLGDEAFGLVTDFTFPLDEGITVSSDGSYLAFRRGRLLGIVVVARFGDGFEDKERRDEVVALARKLDERIQAVLRGEITPAPAATP